MLTQSHELSVYARMNFVPVRGAGCYLFDAAGRRMLDLYAGHAVAHTGHAHPHVVTAIEEQARSLIFYSNAVDLDVRRELAETLASRSGLDAVFFVNSGAEANEQALALARRVTKRKRIVSFEGGFHGRTLGALAASGIPRYRELAACGGAAEPLVDLTTVLAWNDVNEVDEAVTDDVAAVIVEPVQGLGGARAASVDFLQALRAACDRAGALLIFDEVQCGCGRTGAFATSGWHGVVPDALTFAKGIASGLPLGALLVGDRLAQHVAVGDLGTTFGGGPIPCAAALATIQVLEDESLIESTRVIEKHLRERLATLDSVVRVQGRGLLLGLVPDRPAKGVQQELVERDILTGTSIDPSVLRLLPPLVMTQQHADHFVDTLAEILT